MAMRAGTLRHWVVVEKPTAGAANAYGETADTWTQFARVRAAIIPQNSREFQQTQQVRGEMTHLLEIRKLTGITNQMRVVFENRNLNIDGVIEVDERGREMRLACVEEV